MLQPDDVVECVMLAITLPERAVIERLVVRPR
jgi:NADP-dependent 3-hydroxy acid dehydrogenase YdfG